MKDKFGPYIQKLMTTVLDIEQEEFIKSLAFNELKRLNVDIEEFLRKHQEDDTDKVEKTIEKQLLQEDKENVSDK